MSNNKSTHNYEFFSHTSCEFFPCHPTQNPEEFNCLFCYCPPVSHGGNVRWELHLYPGRCKGLQRLPSPAPTGELFLYCGQADGRGREAVREERWVTKEMVRLPRRERDSHKGDYGKLLIVAGSEGYTGAPVFAAQGALRSGAGLVYLGVPRDVYPMVATRCSSAMPFPLLDDTEQLVERARSCDVVLAGPGMGRSPRAQQIVFRLMEDIEGPLVLDADGLNALEGQTQRLRTRTGLTVLTPHDGEFARLAGCSLPLNDRVEQAAELAQDTGCVVVLKGHETLTVDPQGRVWRNTTGNPGMAKGGSGDILAGMIASLLGQKQLTGCVSCPGELVAWAVYLHGAAGDAAAAQYGEYGMLPDDTLAAVAGVLQTHIQAEL